MTADRKHILLTTDFSEESFKAFGPIIDLARSIGAKITLLYVLPAMDHHPTGTPFVSPVPIPSDAEHLARARQDLEKLRERFTGLEVDMQALAGDDIADEVVGYAEKIGADIIALATHGRSGLSRIVMGSCAEQIVRSSTVPVLVVPVRRG